MTFDHVGIPTCTPRSGERYKADIKAYITDPAGVGLPIEYVRYLPDSPVPALVHTLPHTAFRVENLEASLALLDEILLPPTRGSGRCYAFGVKDGAVFELMEYDMPAL